ncbi:hypothetical protein BDR06DRAFT_865355, partial [Suillus hirtellus]
DGLCIASECFNMRKNKQEPIRCTKCQKFNHIAKNYTTLMDTCGTCGDQHQTNNCNTFKTTHCVNCHSNQHTSWSRICPEFTKRCKETNDKFPENRMPYFLTEHIWT